MTAPRFGGTYRTAKCRDVDLLKRVYNLRAREATYAEIGREIGVSSAYARDLYLAALRARKRKWTRDRGQLLAMPAQEVAEMSQPESAPPGKL